MWVTSLRCSSTWGIFILNYFQIGIGSYNVKLYRTLYLF
nr:MAG TPA: hypothetical protein [Caudoviricetes sp.]